MTERAFIYSNLPRELTETPQWLPWRYAERGGNSTKVPLQCSGCYADVRCPRHYGSFEYAFDVCCTQRFRCDGLGFVFTPDDPYAGIDCDNCYPSDAAEIAPWASPIEQRFFDTYHESSPSGKGFKAFCKAKAPRCGQWTVDAGQVEIYDRARFFTVTGWADESIPRVINDHQSDVELLVANLEFLKSKRRLATPASPAGCIPARIVHPDRHNTLVSVAGSLWHRGLDTEEIAAALHTFNQRRCDPPHTPEHIDQIIRSMERSWAR